MTDDMPTNIEELKEKCSAERLARLKAEARFEELKAENRQLKDQLSNEDGV